MRKNKLLLLLALLMTAATGAWADETLLLTIESRDYKTFKSGSKTFDDKVTVTFSNTVKNDGDNWGWYANSSESLLTVAGINGYTITSCKFYVEVDGIAMTGYTIKGESPSVYLSNLKVYTDNSQSVKIGRNGVTKIEVYEAAPAPTGYTVSLKDGVKDADKWTISPNPAAEGQTVTLQYTGRLKVKGVTATSDEKPAEASVPDGAINGKFSVSSTKKVYFSKGNLRYASSKWSFFDNQYDYYTSYSADAWDHFGWSTSATTYGMSTSSNNDDYSGDFVDWGATMGAGWRTLTSDEWAYLLKTRSASTVNGTENGRYAKAKVNDVGGVILFPDTYTHPDGVAAPTGVNATDEYGWEGNSYTAADWTKMESAGCVFLPAAGCRYGSEMIGLGSYGYYGSATPDGADYAYRVKFNSGSLEPANSINRCLGCSVRLVQEATSDAVPAKPAAMVTLPLGEMTQGGDPLNNGSGSETYSSPTFKEGDQIALVHGGVKDVVTVGKPNPDGSAPITGDITVGADNEDIVLVYPADLVDVAVGGTAYTENTDVTNKFNSQAGTLAYIQNNLYIHQGTGKLAVSGASASLKANVSMASQIAIWKLTMKDDYNDDIDAQKVTVKVGGKTVAYASTTSPYFSPNIVYLALNPATMGTGILRIEAEGLGDTYYIEKSGVSLTAGKFYQSTLNMSEE